MSRTSGGVNSSTGGVLDKPTGTNSEAPPGAIFEIPTGGESLRMAGTAGGTVLTDEIPTGCESEAELVGKTIAPPVCDPESGTVGFIGIATGGISITALGGVFKTPAVGEPI